MSNSTQLMGFLIAAGAGGIVAALIVAAWRGARLGKVGAPVVGALVGVAAAAMLQQLGGGALRLEPDVGTIDWPPVIATAAAGGLCGGVSTLAIGLMKLGGRKRRLS